MSVFDSMIGVVSNGSMAHSVPPNRWDAFLSDFNAEHAGWQAAIELHTPGEIPARIADGIPLRAIFLYDGPLGLGLVSVSAGTRDGQPIQHRIDAPRAIFYSPAADSPDAVIRIEPAEGPATLVRVWARAA